MATVGLGGGGEQCGPTSLYYRLEAYSCTVPAVFPQSSSACKYHIISYIWQRNKQQTLMMTGVIIYGMRSYIVVCCNLWFFCSVVDRLLLIVEVILIPVDLEVQKMLQYSA